MRFFISYRDRKEEKAHCTEKRQIMTSTSVALLERSVYASSFMVDEELADTPNDGLDSGSVSSDDSVDAFLFDFDLVPETRQASLLSHNASFPNRVLAPAPLVPNTGTIMKRVTYSVFIERRLEPKRIETILGQQCSCARIVGGRACMDNFDFGAVSGLRYARGRLGAAAEYDLRWKNLLAAAERSTRSCRVLLEGKSICLRAYCMVFDCNESSMRRSWSKVKQGLGIRSMGRPKGSHVNPDPIGENVLKQSCYAWLKAWAEVIADVDPVAIKYKLAVNFVRSQDLYAEYVRHYNSNSVMLTDAPLSFRRFCVVWQFFQREEKIRVRRKANTTTKCSGYHPPRAIILAALFLIPTPTCT